MVRALLKALVLALAVVLTGLPRAGAQEFGTVVSPILTIDQERLFSGSAFGKRAREEIRVKSEALAAENRQIEAELSSEEKDLTERREGLSAEEFRDLADAFDARVQKIRDEQDAKSRDISRIEDAERQAFFSQIVGILGEIVQERGAVIIVERRTVFLASDSIDVTDAAIARIDAILGPGEAQPPTEP